ncbi:unnamed protein product, partial [Porites evermanni]
DDYSIAQLYRRIISPSVKNEEWQKQTHVRHQYLKSQSPVSRLKVASPTHSIMSAPGLLETDMALQPINETSSAVTEKSTTRSEYAGYNFQPTVKFKTTSLPAMSLSRKYSPSPTGTTRTVPISFSHNMGVPSRYWTNENPRILYSRQRDRLKAEEQAKEQCRRMKRTSEILSHRIDKQYYMAGTKIPLQGRYDVDNTDLLQLRLLSQQKQLSDFKAAKDTKFASRNPRDSPSGQLSTPVPGIRAPSSAVSLLPKLDDPTEACDSGLSFVQFSSNLCDLRLVNNVIITFYLADFFLMRRALHFATKLNSRYIKKCHCFWVPSNHMFASARKAVFPAPITTAVHRLAVVAVSVRRICHKKVQRSFLNQSLDPPPPPQKYPCPPPTPEGRLKFPFNPIGKPKKIFLKARPGPPPKPSCPFSAGGPPHNSNLNEPYIFLQDTRYGIINEQQRHVFGLLFDEVDKDKNGSVTLEELKLRMQPSVSRHDIKHFVQVFDLNKDHTVDKREFAAICALNDQISGTKTESEDASLALDLENLSQHIVIFKEMFKTIDEDDDNRLDAGELLVMVSAAMETEIGADLQTAKEVLEGARDEFGFIDFVGFMSYIPFFAKLLRTILEHPLSIAELERARERVKKHDITFKPPKKKAKEPKSWEVF